MKLPELHPDRMPSDDELEEHRHSELGRVSLRPGDSWREMASFPWKIETTKIDPDSFLVPFAHEIRVFPNIITSYRSYQNSKLWKSIRQKVLERSSGRCECCGTRAEEVHHRDYRQRVLRGDDLLPLVSVCSRCHERIHYDHKSGKKYDSWNDAEAALANMYRYGFGNHSQALTASTSSCPAKAGHPRLSISQQPRYVEQLITKTQRPGRRAGRSIRFDRLLIQAISATG
jgi:hypothetical protein